ISTSTLTPARLCDPAKEPSRSSVLGTVSTCSGPAGFLSCKRALHCATAKPALPGYFPFANSYLRSPHLCATALCGQMVPSQTQHSNHQLEPSFTLGPECSDVAPPPPSFPLYPPGGKGEGRVGGQAEPLNPNGHNTKRGKWQPFVSMSELMENYRLWAAT
ncbi:hypothetical protein JOQ06_003674, partial [Pogonophryne albipinna]